MGLWCTDIQTIAGASGSLVLTQSQCNLVSLFLFCSWQTASVMAPLKRQKRSFQGAYISNWRMATLRLPWLNSLRGSLLNTGS